MESKSGFVKAVISVVFGIVGTATVHWLIGIPLAIIGMMLGYASYDFTDRRLSYAGVILNNIAIIWLSIICIVGGK